MAIEVTIFADASRRAVDAFRGPPEFRRNALAAAASDAGDLRAPMAVGGA
ncbi:hypothetical protein [Nannocystis radixulma]|uniref:Uncharacterized protein n=1 Tax=Nannocystis radixulma TaxID=2995305 RepID=A0ABT5BHC4_9BACT|nr:hypothetical protein [Nannocystis radixulma]MDC0673550.1 hypothetical protein [Nannocystis radixulma]